METRRLTPADRPAWEPLWAGYQAFYERSLPASVTEETWRRILDPAFPIHAIGAFEGEALIGIVHWVLHWTTSAVEPRCYLNDLFTAPAARGKGAGRALIDAVCERAGEAGCDRVYWLTHETNTIAQALYEAVAERSGFIQYRKVLTG